MEVGAGVRRFGSRFVNCYLLEEGGRLTLLDAGFPGYWRSLLRELNAIGRRVEDIDAVLLTHSHPDHCGLAERVRQAAGAAVYVHPLETPALKGELEGSRPPFFSQGFRPFIYRNVLHAMIHGAAKKVPVAELTGFADGEVLDVPGTPRVVHCPGHTPGSCALHIKERSILFSGDSLVTIDLLTGRAQPALAPDFVNESTGRALESLGRLQNLDAQTVLPGHGEPWLGGVRRAVELARTEAADNLEAAAPKGTAARAD